MDVGRSWPASYSRPGVRVYAVVLNGENVAGAAAHQLHALAGQVTHLTMPSR